MTSGRVEDEEKKNMSFDCGANNEVKAAFLMCDKNKNPFSLLCPLYYYVTMLFCFMSLPSPLLLRAEICLFVTKLRLAIVRRTNNTKKK